MLKTSPFRNLSFKNPKIRKSNVKKRERITIRQEQKPGQFSDWARAASAGLRTLCSPLSEFVSNEYIAGRSEADKAMAEPIGWVQALSRIVESSSSGAEEGENGRFCGGFGWKWRLLSDLIGMEMQEKFTVYKMEKKVERSLEFC